MSRNISRRPIENNELRRPWSPLERETNHRMKNCVVTPMTLNRWKFLWMSVWDPRMMSVLDILSSILLFLMMLKLDLSDHPIRKCLSNEWNWRWSILFNKGKSNENVLKSSIQRKESIDQARKNLKEREREKGERTRWRHKKKKTMNDKKKPMKDFGSKEDRLTKKCFLLLLFLQSISIIRWRWSWWNISNRCSIS